MADEKKRKLPNVPKFEQAIQKEKLGINIYLENSFN